MKSRREPRASRSLKYGVMDMKGLGKKSLVLVCGLACLLAGCTASERGELWRRQS